MDSTDSLGYFILDDCWMYFVYDHLSLIDKPINLNCWLASSCWFFWDCHKGLKVWYGCSLIFLHHPFSGEFPWSAFDGKFQQPLCSFSHVGLKRFLVVFGTMVESNSEGLAFLFSNYFPGKIPNKANSLCCSWFCVWWAWELLGSCENGEDFGFEITPHKIRISCSGWLINLLTDDVPSPPLALSPTSLIG